MVHTAQGSRQDYFIRRLSLLDAERQSFISHYKELSDFVQPRRGRFFIEDRNKGKKVHNNIVNSHASWALGVARSGMLAGTMSPSRPWFELETQDKDMMEFQPVRLWVSFVTDLIRRILNSGNFYGMASVMLNELLQFGTGCMLHVDDFDDVARFYTQTVGSYYLAQNNRLEVDTLVREFQWTTSQIVAEFGLENVSQTVRTSWDRGNYDHWHTVLHVIEPNVDSVDRPDLGILMPFVSVYMEKHRAATDKPDRFLRVAGFNDFPGYCPRWETTGEDIYGTDCPGMIALGDVKGLQAEEREKAKAVQKMVTPPLHGPPSLRNVPVNNLPGGITTYSGQGPQQLSPIYQVTPPLNEMRVDMQAIEERINKAYYVNLFQAISAMAGIQPRNELDIMSRNEERLLQLGPVLERVHGEFLSPMIDRVFNQALQAGILPPIPPELSGQDLKVKFISNLAIAQRAVVTSDLDRILAATAGAAQIDPNAAKKFDGAQWVDEYGRALGVPPRVIRSDEDVEAMIAAEQQQIQQQQALEAASVGAQAAQAASSAKTDEPNLLTDMAAQQRGG